MAHPVMFDDDDPLLARLRPLALAFPGAEEYVSHGRPNFRSGKNFAVFGGSEKQPEGGYREVPGALMVKVEDAERPALDQDDRLDASYRLVAPKRMIAELDAR